jgi:hypothetical protein
MERPGRCYPAAVLVEPAIACFGRFDSLDSRTTTSAILGKPSLEIQSSRGLAYDFFPFREQTHPPGVASAPVFARYVRDQPLLIENLLEGKRQVARIDDQPVDLDHPNHRIVSQSARQGPIRIHMERR